MMTSIFGKMFLAIVVLLSTAGMTVAERADFRIAESPRGTSYYDFAHRLAENLTAAGYTVELVPTAGAAENGIKICEGEVDLAPTQMDVYMTIGDDHGDTGVDNCPMSIVSRFGYQYVYLLVPPDSPINDLHDLDGRKVFVGPMGSGTLYTWNLMFKNEREKGISDWTKAIPVSAPYSSIEKLADDGQIEAVMLVSRSQSAIPTHLINKGWRELNFHDTDISTIMLGETTVYEEDFLTLTFDLSLSKIRTYRIPAFIVANEKWLNGLGRKKQRDMFVALLKTAQSYGISGRVFQTPPDTEDLFNGLQYPGSTTGYNPYDVPTQMQPDPNKQPVIREPNLPPLPTAPPKTTQQVPIEPSKESVQQSPK